MNLSSYYDLISNENKAKKYLLVKCFKKHQMFYPSSLQLILVVDEF
jgi:hypothetical protein